MTQSADSSANLSAASQQGDCSAAGALASTAGTPASAAAQSNQMPVVSPDQMPVPSDIHEAPSPLLPEHGDQLLQRQADSAIALAQGCNSAVDAVLCWIDFDTHDLPLNSTRGKRITTNCASLWAYVLDTRPDLVEEFMALIQTPGSAAHQAILDFSAAVISWPRPQKDTLTGLLLAGMTYHRQTHAAAEAN